MTRFVPNPAAFSGPTPLFKHSTRLHSETSSSLSSFDGFFWRLNASCRTRWLAGPQRKRFRRPFCSTRGVNRSKSDDSRIILIWKVRFVNSMRSYLRQFHLQTRLFSSQLLKNFENLFRPLVSCKQTSGKANFFFAASSASPCLNAVINGFD